VLKILVYYLHIFTLNNSHPALLVKIRKNLKLKVLQFLTFLILANHKLSRNSKILCNRVNHNHKFNSSQKLLTQLVSWMKLWHVCQCSHNQDQINLLTLWWDTWLTNQWRLKITQCRQILWCQCKQIQWCQCNKTQWCQRSKTQWCKWIQDSRQIQILLACNHLANPSRAIRTNKALIPYLHQFQIVDSMLWTKLDSQVLDQAHRNQVDSI